MPACVEDLVSPSVIGAERVTTTQDEGGVGGVLSEADGRKAGFASSGPADSEGSWEGDDKRNLTFGWLSVSKEGGLPPFGKMIDTDQIR